MIALLPAPADVARAVMEGHPVALPHATDWPHADTGDALRALAEHPEHHVGGTFLVLEDGVVVGDCGWFGPPDEEGEVEVGYGLAPSARGRGVGTEAVRQLLAWVEAQGATRVRAEVLPGNEASLRLLRRLGFTTVGRAEPRLVLTRVRGEGGAERGLG